MAEKQKRKKHIKGFDPLKEDINIQAFRAEEKKIAQANKEMK